MQGFLLNVAESMTDKDRLREKRSHVINTDAKARVRVKDEIKEQSVSGHDHMVLEKGKEYLEPHAWAKEAASRGFVDILGIEKQGNAKLAYVAIQKPGFEWNGLIRQKGLRICMLEEDANKHEVLGNIKINKRFDGDMSEVTR